MLCLTSDDNRYPSRLHALADPPGRIYVSGRWPVRGPVVALIGARRASEAGLAAAEALGRAAAEAGVWVVSGGAIGIDAAAHRGALDAGGPTLAVLGTGLEDPGPRTNRPLFCAMLQRRGGLLTEIDRPPVRADFVRRNRLIAALADWVVVVEAQARSGTRATLAAARTLGRRLGAVTWSMNDPRGAQAMWVFAHGGSPIDGPEALLRSLGRRRRRRGKSPSPPTEHRSIDGWVESSGTSAADALARLTELELEGRGARTGGGRFRSSPPSDVAADTGPRAG